MIHNPFLHKSGIVLHSSISERNFRFRIIYKLSYNWKLFHLKENSSTLTVYWKTFVQTEFVIIVRIFGWTNLTIRAPSCAHCATAICLCHCLYVGSSCGASASDRLQETIAYSAIWKQFWNLISSSLILVSLF